CTSRARLIILYIRTALMRIVRANDSPPIFFLCWRVARAPDNATLVQVMRSWLEPIVAMWRFSKTNGTPEGFHTKNGHALASGLWDSGILRITACRSWPNAGGMV